MYVLLNGGAPLIISQDLESIRDRMMIHRTRRENQFRSTSNPWERAQYPTFASYDSACMQRYVIVSTPDFLEISDGFRGNQNITNRDDVEDVTHLVLHRERQTEITGRRFTAEIVRRGLVTTGQRVDIDIRGWGMPNDATVEQLEEKLREVAARRGNRIDVRVQFRGMVSYTLPTLGNFQVEDLTRETEMISFVTE